MQKANCLANPTGLKFGLVLIVVVIVISSPIVMLVNPAFGKPSTTSTSTPLPTISTTPSAPSTIGQDGRDGDFTAQAALSGVNARPSNNIVSVNSYYEVMFTTATAGIIKFIDITFPAGTIIGSAPLLLVEKEGIGDGTATKVSNTEIRYTVTSAVNVPAGTKIRLEFFNIVNPALAGSYAVTVTTRNAGGTAIDGPTGSTINTIKQIGSGQIADGAITSTKPAESFMKRVTVLDNEAGHAVGWDPNGIASTFIISEPAISSDDSTFISIEVDAHFGCDVTLHSGDSKTFRITCDFAPASGLELHYVVENLPPHVVS